METPANNVESKGIYDKAVEKAEEEGDDSVEDDEEAEICGTNENADSTVNNDATVNDTHGGDEEVDDADNAESIVNDDDVVDEGG